MDRPFYPEKIFEFIPELLPYLLVTFEILIGTVIVGLVLGFFLARAMLSKHKWKRNVAGFIINAFRCTPSIVMLFIIFYGLPNLFWALFKVDINDWAKAFYVITALGLLFSASAAEIMRGSYLAVPAGQREAALTSGLTEKQSFIRIMLPQAFVVSLPNFGNSLIALLKEGSLAFTIGLIDVMGKGNLIISMNFGGYALETYTALAIIYWVLTILLEQLFKRIEKHFSKGRKSL
ncbi:MAG: amino acid ABC transporter permease [Spirochaetaceae bacterium]|nr:amino acid ABC transporter permease [Spirochaetaceae bacterium]MBO4706023.1 amino acid ABC transporter permease [Spirochaetaceae bacterium]